MSEQPEPSERTANRSPEHLTFAEAAERLNISADAVRMRVHRGTLASIRANERTFVLWPQPKHPHEHRTERTHAANRSAVQNDDRLVAALQEELAFLRGELSARTEEIHRRDVIIANLVESVRALPAGESSRGEASTEHRAERAPTEQAPRPWWRLWER